MKNIARYIWASPVTAIGYLLSRVCGAGITYTIMRHPLPHVRVFRVTRLLPNWAVAQCWGHIILAKQRATKQTMNHELVHTRQCETWGPFILMLYPMASLWAVVLGKHYYRDNAFEVEANSGEER